jgi:mRNA-degrading endonuclease RelE of RelBE toxin-antitoxin system
MRALWARSAWKDLQDLPKAKQTAILEAVSRFAADPFGRHPSAKPLAGERNAVRPRGGDYRVILDRGRDTLEVRAVAHRREVYR